MTTSTESLKVAVLDDDSGFVQVLSNRLERAGAHYRVRTSGLPPEELVAMRVNALVVDLGAVGSDPWSFLERVCTALPGMAVVVCSAPCTVGQRVRGLRLGVDDWITKPCHPEEVVARLEAIVRRGRRAQTRPEGPAFAGPLEVRADQFQAFADGRSADLTRREFEVLQLLVDAEGQVLQREEIYQRVWGYTMAHGDRSVDVFVRKLRQKIEKCSPGWRYIHTHFGIGYRLQAEPLEGTPDAAARQENAAIAADAEDLSLAAGATAASPEAALAAAGHYA